MENTLTVERLKFLQAEWQINPPLAVIVAAFLGIKPKEQGTHDDLVERLGGVEI
ncbi:MAG: hypothetical protein WCL30_03965 [Pseudomonadota bacterium]